MKAIQGNITSPFGDRIHPVTRTKTFHNGIDIACPIGTEILSPLTGEIKDTYDHPAGGKTLIIGDNDTRIGFCHLSRIYFPVGTKITKGSIIALSGNTGKSTGPHCHFTVKTGGKWKNTEYLGGQYINPVKHIEL